jgi:outer membrane protein
VPFLCAPAAVPRLPARHARPLAQALAALAALVLSTPAAAIDLLEAYRAAVANDAQLASARAQFAATRELVPQARAGLLPQVSAGVAIEQQWLDTQRTTTRDFLGQSYGVQLSYPLYRLQNLELLEQSRLQVTLGEAQFREVQQQLIVRVAQAYFDVLSAQDNVATIDAQKRAIAEQLASAKRNFEVGTATITDQQEAQARYDLTVAQEFAAASELEVRRATFEQLIGRPAGELESLRPGLGLEGPQPARESEWVESARQDSYPVQQAVLAGEIARREIDLQRYARYPTVDIVSSVGHSRNSQASNLGVRTNSASIGVELAIPLYTGGAISSRVRQAAASHERALADLETVRRNAELAARQSFLGLTSGLAQVRALEAAERSSQLALDSNLLGYQVGVRINIDVLNAQQQLFTTRRDLARARYDVLVNGLRLKETAGTLDEDDLQRVDGLLMPPSQLPASADSGTSTRPSAATRAPSEGPSPSTGGTPARRAGEAPQRTPAAGGPGVPQQPGIAPSRPRLLPSAPGMAPAIPGAMPPPEGVMPSVPGSAPARPGELPERGPVPRQNPGQMPGENAPRSGGVGSADPWDAATAGWGAAFAEERAGVSGQLAEPPAQVKAKRRALKPAKSRPLALLDSAPTP